MVLSLLLLFEGGGEEEWVNNIQRLVKGETSMSEELTPSGLTDSSLRPLLYSLSKGCPACVTIVRKLKIVSLSHRCLGPSFRYEPENPFERLEKYHFFPFFFFLLIVQTKNNKSRVISRLETAPLRPFLVSFCAGRTLSIFEVVLTAAFSFFLINTITSICHHTIYNVHRINAELFFCQKYEHFYLFREHAIKI